MVICLAGKCDSSVYLRVLILVGEQLRDCNVLFAKCPDGGQALKSHGDVGIERTSSCK